MTHYQNTDVDVSLVMATGTAHVTMEVDSGQGHDEAVAKLQKEIAELGKVYGIIVEFEPERPPRDGSPSTYASFCSEWGNSTPAELMKELEQVAKEIDQRTRDEQLLYGVPVVEMPLPKGQIHVVAGRHRVVAGRGFGKTNMAKSIMDYFAQRVVAGMGVPAVYLGRP